MDGTDTAVTLDGIQHSDETVTWTSFVQTDEHQEWSAAQLRRWAAVLIEAADELDSLND
jgi:hypothetical protein